MSVEKKKSDYFNTDNFARSNYNLKIMSVRSNINKKTVIKIDIGIHKP